MLQAFIKQQSLESGAYEDLLAKALEPTKWEAQSQVRLPEQSDEVTAFKGLRMQRRKGRSIDHTPRESL